MRADSLAGKLSSHNYCDFWKEVKVLNNCKAPLPSNINGVCGSDSIAELWRQHYYELFNCINNDPFVPDDVDPIENLVVSHDEVKQAILKLENNKAGGADRITAEHLKHASSKVIPLLSLCFYGFFKHGILPDSMIAVQLVPVIKDKTGKINSKDNYRPIALASVLSKVLETIILNRIEMYISTNYNQFGFKRKHGTDMCIFALKELLSKYQGLNTTMFLCFIDSSKAFDRINHSKLFQKLTQRGVPKYIVRILAFWYANQLVQIKWGSSVSVGFKVSNGVRQGGILSPYLYNVFMDDLSNRLNKCKTGCIVGDTVTNHFMYADDLVAFSPCSAGLQEILSVCSQYGAQFDIKYNAEKSNIMIVRSREDRGSVFPMFFLSGNALGVCNEAKYLGHYLSDDLSDDRDIQRQCNKLYAQANMLKRRFHMCSSDVKASLFRAYCTPLYTAHLWDSYKAKSFQRLNVAYNDALRMLLRVPRWHSASQLFVSLGIPTFKALLRNLMYSFMCRLNESVNDIIMKLSDPAKSSYRFSSSLWCHWRSSLYKH